MIPAAFDYAAPATLEDAVALLAERQDDAKVLTGGHSLIPLLKLRLARPGLLIDLRRLADLRTIRREDGMLLIGAAATHHDVMRSPAVRAASRLLVETAAQIGDVQVRNVGTIGGSIVHADPAADWPAALLALGAVMTLRSTEGSRTVAAQEFFRGPLESAAGPNEILTSIAVPVPAQPEAGAYLKIKQSASGFALAGVAVQVDRRNDLLSAVRIAVTGVAETPFRARDAEQMLAGEKPSESRLREAAERSMEGVTALADLHASSAYRRHLGQVLVRRALEQALNRPAAR